MRPSGAARQGVFVSYARTDGETAARGLHARLTDEAPDIQAWLDRFEIEGGVGWWNQIEQELDRAEFLVLVMTPGAMRSENTRREWRSARQRGVCVYPVKAAPDAHLDFAQLPSWMRKAHFYDPVLEWPKLIAHLRRGCQATRVPFMAPALPPNYVARGEVSEALIDQLLAQDSPTPVALRGAGGFGKTTLAAAICHDERVAEAFDDGILWVTLGQTPNLLNETVKLYAALTGERPGFVDDEDAARELSGKLADKNCLIVIDDAWQAGHARRFLLGGPGCAHLVTTRLLEVAPDARTVEVDRMTAAQALQLLVARSGAADLDARSSGELVARLGLWPLAIKLAGSAMHQRIQRGDSGSNALDYVTRALDKRGITAFDRNDATDRSDAVARTIGASLDLLDRRDQLRCIELAVFPEDKAVPLEAVAHLWQCDDLDGEDLARRLDELALVDLDLRHGILRMHDTLRTFMAAQLADQGEVHARLLEAWGDPNALPYPYAWRTFAYHMRCAGRSERMRALLLDATWLRAKMAATDVHAVIGDFDAVDASGALALLRDALRLSASAVATDASEWRSQLYGRLLGRHEPEIADFVQSLATASDTPWLRLLHPTLDSPGGMLRMTLSAHSNGVNSLASDAHHERLVSGSADSLINVWDWESGQLVTTLPGRALGVTALAASADGKRVLSGNADGVIEMWDVDRHERLQRFSAHDRRGLRAIAMSSEPNVAVSASRDAELLVWDLASPHVLHELRGHTESVTSVALSADGAMAVSGSDDCTVRVWRTATGTLVRTLCGHGAGVNAVALSADGSRVLSGSTDLSLKLWDTVSGACLLTLRGHSASVTAVALASAVGRGLSGASDAGVTLWDLATGTAIATLTGHSDAVRGATISADGVVAATASTDRTIKLWQLDRQGTALLPETHRGAVVALAFSPDGRLCSSGGVDGRIKIHDVSTGQVLRSIDAHAAPIRSLAFTPDSSCVLSAGIEDKYWLWIVETGERTWIPVNHTAPVDYSGFSAISRYLVTCCQGGTVYLWDVPSGVGVATYGTRRLFDHLIAPSPKRRVQTQADELMDVYMAGEAVYDVGIARVDRGGRHAVLSATRRDSAAFAGNSAERRAAPAGDRACLLVFEIETRRVRTVTAPQADVITAFDCDESGTKLLWAAADHTLAFWCLDRDELIVRCQGHSGKINAVALCADGGHAVSCSTDRRATVWNLGSGEAVASLTTDAALRSLALAPDGVSFAVGDVSGRVHFVRFEVGTSLQS